MKYVVDKNTNRMIYQVPVDGKYLVDEHSYLVDAEAFVLEHRAWDYRFVDGRFVYVEPPQPRAARLEKTGGTQAPAVQPATRKGRMAGQPRDRSA